MTLGNCINLIAEGVGKKNSTRVIPYRESILTRLLQENLSGNSAMISPADYNYIVSIDIKICKSCETDLKCGHS